MKNNDFRSENGDIHGIVRKVPAHDCYFVGTIWQGPCNCFGDLQGRPKDAIREIVGSTFDPQGSLRVRGLTKKTRKEVFAQDLSRPGPKAQRMVLLSIEWVGVSSSLVTHGVPR